ncbi:MAG: hypothetical protein ACHQQQ_08935 [Bacteroidota bacterium]
MYIYAQTPITLYQNYTGNVNFVVAGGSFRNKSNGVDPCSTTPISSYTVSNLPSDATVLAAYLYWVGDYSTDAGSNLAAPDYNIRLDGNPITASRTFTLSFVYGGGTYPYFSGFANVTSYVQSKKNGTYTVDSLSTNTSSPHCAIEGVVSGWAMLIVYQSAGETKHCINIYDGFNYFLNSSITFKPGNFYVPYSGKSGKLVHFTWEGDSTISGPQEFLSFNGTHLFDAINPDGNQFNSISSALGGATTYGVDVDGYDVTAYLTPGDTNATSVYSTGGDMVLLSMETISCSDTNTADVSILKSHSPAGTPIVAGTAETFTLMASNNGPDNAGNMYVTDSIPAGIRVVSFNCPHWSVDSTAKPKYVFTLSGLNPPSTDSIKINTIITDEGYPGMVRNTATVRSQYLGDRRPWNNTATDSFSVSTPIFSTSTKTVSDRNGSSYRPKDTLVYTIKARNTGNYVGTNTIVLDSVPSGLNIVPGSLSPAGTISGQVITFNGVTIAVGDSATYTFRVVEDSTVAFGTPVVNRARIRCLTVDQLVTASFSASRPSLFLRKTSSASSGSPGDTLTYTLKYGNLGSDTAKTVSALDTIPANCVYITSSVTGTGTSYDGTGNRIVVSRTAVVPGDTNNTVTFKVRVNTPLSIGITNIVNNAKISCLLAPSVVSSVTVPITATSVITVTKSGPASIILAGSPTPYAAVTYKLVYSVTGKGIIDSVYLNDTLPAGMSFKSASNGGVLSGSVVKWNLGTITPNKTDSVTVIDSTTTAATYVNHARMTRRGDTTGVLSNNVSTVIGSLNFSTSTKTATDINGGSLLVADSIRYIITITNSGTVAAPNVVVTDTLPARVKVKTGSIKGGGTLSGNVITWPAIASLAVSASAKDTVTVVLDSLAQNGIGIINTANISSSGVNQIVTATSTPSGTATISTSTKTAVDINGGSTVAGDSILYTIKVKNTGTAATSLVTVTDTLPARVKVKSSTISTGGSQAGNVITWATPSALAVGDSATYSFQAVLDSLVQNGVVVTNKANINASGLNQVVTANTTPNGTSNISTSTKTAIDLNGGSGAAGDTILYTIKVKNSGTAATSVVTATDTIPTRVKVKSGTISAGGSQAGNIITWATPAILAVGDSATYTFKAILDSLIQNGVAVTNKANINASGINQLVSATTTPNGAPNFSSSTKSGVDINGGSLVVGDSILYTIKVKNTGTAASSVVTVTDTIPARVKVKTGTISSGGSLAGNIITWATPSTMAVGDSATYTFKAILDSLVQSGVPVTNNANINANGVNQLVSASNTPNGSANISTSTKTGVDINGGSLVAGDSILYTIKVKNTGTAATSLVTVTDTIPARMKVKSGTISTGGSQAGNIITWATPSTLAVGDSSIYTFKAVVDSLVQNGIAVTNNAHINASGLNQLVSASNTPTGTANISTSSKTAVDINGGSTVAGDSILYTIKVKNTGTAATSLVTVTDTIPARVKVKSGTISAGGSQAGNIITWSTPATLAVGDSTTYTFKTVLDSLIQYGVAVTNNANINASSLNKLVSAVTTPNGLPDFSSSSKTYQNLNGGSVISGDSIKYTLRVKNTGFVTATNVVVTDTLPAHVKVKAGSISNGGTLSGSVITWPTISQLTIGDSTIYMVTVVVDSAVANGGTVTNTLNINANGVNQVKSASFTVVNLGALFIRKTVDKSSGSPGDTLTYTIKYGDIGTDSARSVTLLDTIPANTSYAGTVTGTGASYDGAHNRIIVTRTNPIAQGDTNNIATFKVKVNSPLPLGSTVLTNKVFASASNASTVGDSVKTSITASSTVTISKSGPVTALIIGSPTPNAKVSYTIRYSVTGNGIVDSTFINDTLPPGMSYASSTGGGVLSSSIVKWNLGTLSPGVSDSVMVTDSTTTPATYVNHARITWKANPSGVLGNDVTTRVYVPHTAILKQTIAIIPGQSVADTVNDIDIAGRGKIVVSLQNTRTAESEIDTLTETGGNSGIFVGAIPTVFGTSSNGNNNGSFAVQAGDTIRGSYVDSVNASGILATIIANTRINGGHTAVIAVNPTSFAGGTNLVWTLNDTDLNHNPAVAESYSYTAQSSTGEIETISFTETGINSGIFSATLATVVGPTPGVNNNGVMNIQPGDTVTVTYHDTLTAIGNSAIVSARAIAGTVNFSTSSKSVTDLNGGLVVPYDTMYYQIRAKNTGTVTATSVVIVDSLPTQITVVPGSITAGGVLSSTVITFAPFDLHANDSMVVSYRVTIDTTITDGAVKTNRAHIRGNGQDQLETSSFTAYDRPVMTLVKAVDKNNAKPGDTLSYTVTYTNTGVALADSVTVTDITPQYTTYIHNTVVLNNVSKTDASDADEVTVAYDTPTAGRGSIIINVGKLSAGHSGIYKFKVVVK